MKKTSVLLLSALIVCSLGFWVSGSSDFRMLKPKPLQPGTLRFSDNNLLIDFAIPREEGYRRISFVLKNKTEKTISINWNKTSISLPAGKNGVIHKGIEYGRAGDSMKPTTIPVGASYQDFIVSTLQIENSKLKKMGLQKGSVVSLHLALQIGDKQKTYQFKFEILRERSHFPWLMAVGILVGVGIVGLTILNG